MRLATGFEQMDHICDILSTETELQSLGNDMLNDAHIQTTNDMLVFKPQ